MFHTALARLVFAFLVLAQAALVATGQECVAYHPPDLHDSTTSCVGNPRYPRSVALDTFRWGASEYLVNDIGNELLIHRLDDPQNPTFVHSSSFRVPLTTDDDENLKYMSICDDCRYGVAGFGIEGVVLFDLGTGASPRFSAKALYSAKPVNSHVNGGFTYMHGGVQWLMANAVTSGCSGSGLYRFDSIDMAAGDLIQCVQNAGGVNIPVDGGVYLSTNQGTFLYVVGYGQVHIYRVGSVGSDLTYLGAFADAASPRAFAVDAAVELAISTSSSNVKLWDISAPADPAVLWSGAPAGDLAPYVAVDLQYPLAFAAKAGRVTSGKMAHLLDITNPTNPVPVGEAAWDVAADHNTLSSCMWNYDADFSSDGSTLYQARYSVTQVFEVDLCVDAPPLARIAVTPGTGFPGDTLTIGNTSAGPYTLSAIWVEDDLGMVHPVGADQLGSTTPPSRSFTIPVDVAAGRTFTAKVAVGSAEYPYNPQLPGEQLASRAITVSRNPAVTIAMAPGAPITGQTVTLSATAEGQPQSYEWQITTPVGASCPTAFPNCFATGSSIQVPLVDSGDWRFDLAAEYLHLVDGVPYRALADRAVSVSSVAAAFTVSPAAPEQYQPITLTSTSNVANGVAPAYSWSVIGPSAYTGCPSEATCTIPGGSLVPGTYTFGLTISNPTNGDQDTTTKTVTVFEVTLQLDFSWFPASPRIGDLVNFTLSGVSGIGSATWDMGGASCDTAVYPTTYTCNPGPFESCLMHAHTYATGGTKTVSVSVTIDGATIGPVSLPVTVQNTGTCAVSIQSFPMGGADIGQTVTFTLSGQPSFDRAEWDFGAPGCTTPQQATCTVGEFGATCLAQAHKFAEAGTHTVRVTLKNGASIVGSTTTWYTINNAGSCNPSTDATFSFTPASPMIGSAVSFLIDAPGTVTRADWNFGGPGCSGFDQIASCVPGQFTQCGGAAYRYASSGAKLITLEVEVGGVLQPLLAQAVIVEASGSCPQDLTVFSDDFETGSCLSWSEAVGVRLE